MKMKAAILYEQGREHPFTQSKALSVEEVELDPELCKENFLWCQAMRPLVLLKR